MVWGMNGAVGEDSILGDLVSCEESGDSPAALDSDPMVNREQTGAHIPLKRSSLPTGSGRPGLQRHSHSGTNN